MILVTNFQNAFIPILRMDFILNSCHLEIAEVLKIIASYKINCTYYNYKTGIWEPVIEDYSYNYCLTYKENNNYDSRLSP